MVPGWLHMEGRFIPDWGYAPRGDGGGIRSPPTCCCVAPTFLWLRRGTPLDYISRPRRGVVPPIPTWTLKVTENRTEAAA